ncbi:MAG: hypothetical protein ABI321_23450 [Polyangia bacterium]
MEEKVTQGEEGSGPSSAQSGSSVSVSSALPGRRAAGARGSGLVARWAGGVAALVLLGSAVAGLGFGSYTARNHAVVRARVVAAMRDVLVQRLEAQTKALATEVSSASTHDDWTRLQMALPVRAAIDPQLVMLAATDTDGLVLAASQPAENGHPLREAKLRSVLERADGVPVLVDLEGTPVIVAARRVQGLGDRERIVWAAFSTAGIGTVDRALQGEARAAIARGWWVVLLSGFVCAAVAVAAVLLAGGALARGLRVVAWRISELGRGDRSTHVRLDGPSELQHVGVELERAAERLALAAEASAERKLAERDREALDALRERLLPPLVTVGAVRVRLSGTPPRHAAALATRHAGSRTVVAIIEVVGERIEDALLAAELRATVMASDLDEPAALVNLLHTHAGAQRARAIVVAIDAERAAIGNAGSGFAVHRSSNGDRPVVVRGDRLGESDARRDPVFIVELGSTEALVLRLEARGTTAELLVERLAS